MSPKQMRARQALMALYLKVPGEVAKDVTNAVMDALDELELPNAAPLNVQHLATIREAAELYEQSHDEECLCFDQPDSPCPACLSVERARKKLESIIGPYRQV